MDFDDYGDEPAYQDGPPGPEDYDFSEDFSGGFRERGYGRNQPPFFGGEYGPPGRPFTWGRGFGPAGPPMHMRFPREHKPLKFLIRCGVPKPQLKGLPDALLRLIEPHYCGICAQELQNFDLSRLHYISKNHAKNQKKWLVQQAEVGFHRPKEIPLKARDLYCELCDVHITSKTHAESHYSGRSHRGIVEGRKPPKNPFLLQRGMEDRIEQLIRREKKQLKPVEASEASADQKKDAKPIQPDLYCEICKTSVTCSEQMTMHLNGKRHLAKEKHHILQMMKQPASNKKKQNAPAKVSEGIKEVIAVQNSNPEAVVADAENASENKDQNVNDDWGNGSGAWDETPQQSTDAM
ncbi:zinc finger matrin-type protein 3 [Helicoverpa armigera]|uniref:zinc finger matrin-type protein 3 n=1 Tax=Helicoverpa armigera TaxID=29058 RepID=UPI003082E134